MNQYQIVLNSLLSMIKHKANEISVTTPQLIEQQGPFIVLLQCLLDVQTDYLNQMKSQLTPEEYKVIESTALQLMVADTPEQIEQIEQALLNESILTEGDSGTFDDLSNVIPFGKKDTVQ